MLFNIDIYLTDGLKISITSQVADRKIIVEFYRFLYRSQQLNNLFSLTYKKIYKAEYFWKQCNTYSFDPK